MSACILIRHAETDMAGRFCGHADPPLNAAGWQQARQLMQALVATPPALIYASDLQRAWQTAEPIAQHCGVTLVVRPGLREIGFGRWEGMVWDEIEAHYPQEAERWLQQYPHGVICGAEAFDSFRLRVRSEMEFLLAQAAMQVVVAVTHAGFLRTVLAETCGWPEEDARAGSARYGSIIAIGADGRAIPGAFPGEGQIMSINSREEKHDEYCNEAR